MHLLIIEDHNDINAMIQDYLQKQGFQCDQAYSGTEGRLYYSINDYDLIEWIYTSEALKVIGDKKTYATWQEGFFHIFEYIENNRDFVMSTYHSVSREHLENFLYQETYRLLMDVVEEQAKDKSVREEDKAFIANFYKYGFVGLILEWIGKGMKDSPKKIIDRLDIVIHGDIDKALKGFQHIV